MIIDTYQTEIQTAIIRFLVANPDGASGREIYKAIKPPCSEWTLYYELRKLREAGYITATGHRTKKNFRLADDIPEVDE